MLSLTDWAATILESHEDIIVPVKKLWVEYCKKASGVSLEDFTRILRDDARFEFMPDVNPRAARESVDAGESPESAGEMEEIGFFAGPRVKLRSRAITPAHIELMLKKHTDRMIASLWSAYDVRPADMSDAEEGDLMELIARAKELQLEIEDALREAKSRAGEMGDTQSPARS